MTNVRPDFSLNPMAALVVAYNTVAEHLPETKPVAKFTDKATAVARLNKILDAAHDAGFVVSYLPNGAIDEIVQMTGVEVSGAPATIKIEGDEFVDPTEIEETVPTVYSATGELVDGTVMVPYETLAEKGEATTTEVAAAPARGKRQSALMGKTITLVVEQNPKRKDSRTRTRYDLYKTGLTTDEYMAQSLAQGLGTVREVLSDLHYDSTMGFIKLS